MSTDPSVLRRNVRRDARKSKKTALPQLREPRTNRERLLQRWRMPFRRLPLKLQRDLPFSGPYLQMMPQGLRRTASAGASFRGGEKTAND